MSTKEEMEKMINENPWGYFVGDQTPEEFIAAAKSDGFSTIKGAVTNYIEKSDTFIDDAEQTKDAIAEALIDYLDKYFKKA